MKREFTKLMAALALLTCLVPLTGWGQTKITNPSGIQDGKTYYIGATLSNNTDYYLKLANLNNGTDYGTPVTNIEQATTFTFHANGTNWTIELSNGKFLSTLPTDNGKLTVATTGASFTATSQSSKIRLSNNNRSIQRNNNSGTSRFGSYANSQTDVWLIEVVTGYSVTFDCDGGNGCPEDMTGITTGSFTVPDVIPMKDCYTFDNVYLDADAGEYVPGETYSISSNLTLTASWTLNKYNVNYHSNNGLSEDISDENKNCGSSYFIADDPGFTAPAGTPYFVNWNTEDDGSGDTYTVGQEITISGNLDLYAQWSATTYHTVSYDCNGVTSGCPNNASVEHGTQITLPAAPIYAGHTFNGWMCSGDLETYAAGVSYTVNADVEFEAQWLENTATPSFDPVASAVLSGTTVTISCTTANAAIQYSTDNGYTWTDYTAPIAITAATTIKAKATASGYAPSAEAEAAYTIVTPYTVAEAIAAINQSYPIEIENAYATGIVCQVDSYNANYHSITYWISDDGTTDTKLEVYGGLGIDDGENQFNSKDDIKVNDIVVVKGTLTKFGSTYEFAQNNRLISLTRNPSITFEPSSVTFGESNATQVVTYTVNNYQQWEYVTAASDANWLTVTTPVYPSSGNPTGTVQIHASDNTGGQRTATVTLTYTYGGGKTVTGTITVSQKGAAVFVNGIYSESLETQESFDNMFVNNVTGSNAWEFDSTYDVVFISGEPGDEDWLVTPKMNVANGKMDISFYVARDEDYDYLSVKWYNNATDIWSNLDFEQPSSTSSNYKKINLTITTGDASFIKIAFVYNNPSTGSDCEYDIYGFEAHQYYTLSFDKNGGTGSMDSQLLAAGNTSLPGCSYTYAGKQFGCWNTKADGTGVDYAAGDSYTLTGDATLYAKWNDPATITFNINGVPSMTASAFPGTVDLSNFTAPVTGDTYTFAGWCTDPSNITLLPSSYELSANVTLFAVYSEGTAGYQLVTSVDDITDGTYLIGAFRSTTLPSPKAYYMATGSLSTTNDKDLMVTSSTASPSENVFVTKPDGAGEFELVGNNTDGFTVSANNSYLGVADFNTNRRLSMGNTAFYWKFALEGSALSTGAVSMSCTNSENKTYTVSENATTGQAVIRGYKGTTVYRGFYLFKQVGSLTATPGTLNAVPTIVNVENGVTVHVLDGAVATITGTSYNASSLIVNDGAELKTANAVYATVEKNITGYGNSTKGNYYLVSAPAEKYLHVASTNANVDAYHFDAFEQGAEWRNFKLAAGGAWHVAANSAVLYASKNDTTLSLDGYGIIFNTPYPGANVVYNKVPATNADVNVDVVFNSGKTFEGWNLIGNPFTCTAYLVGGGDFYRMNTAGDALIINTDAQGGGNAIDVCEGIFVQCTANGTVSFTTTEPEPEPTDGSNGNNGMVNISVAQVVNSRDAQPSADYARIRINNGQNMTKFVFNENTSRVYISQNGKDYAVVRSNAEGEIPVSFKAAQNGNYTISVEAENLDVNYLHLIDNKTGEDVDLLAIPSYSFEAKTTDYASRFRLVFNANNGSNENGNETFAYYNGSEWMINNMGDATLQVIDVMGRVLSSETVSGNATINLNQMPGVYMLRLVNGDSVKVQKVVVR